MAADRLAPFLDPRTMYSSGLTSDFIFRGGGTLFPNLQFIPERIVQFSMTPEGIRYYKVQWQESWLPEHQLLQHQSLIEAYWRTQNEIATNSNHQMQQVQNQVKLVKAANNASSNVGFLSDLNNLSELAAAESDAMTVTAMQTPVTQPSTTAAVAQETLSESVSSQANETQQQHQTHSQQQQQSQSQQIQQQQNESNENEETVEPSTRQEAKESKTNIQVLVENIEGDGSGFVIQEIPLDVVLDQNIATTNEEEVLTPKASLSTWKRKPNTQSLQLEGFDLVNIENNTASVEELAMQARETLSSFRRKRVRFPNGTSKLPQQCFFCLKTLSNRKKLREHQFSVHFKNVGEFMCGICKQRFVFGRQLKAHMLVHSDNRNFQCNICGLTCKRRSHLHKHMDTHRQEKNYRCDVCHQNFKVQAALKTHCLSQHKNQLSKCNVCKQTLHTAFSVYIHSMRHSGTRDHLCDTCGASFKRKQHLIAHLNTHKETKEKIKCPECDKEVPDKKYFRKHLEQFHKDLAANYRYEYVCSICDKDFAYKGRLDEHMKGHENETDQERFSRSRKKRVDSLSEEALSQISDQAIKCIDPKTQEVKLRCKLCRKREFRMISSFEKHIQDHNSGRIKSEEPMDESFDCDSCDKSFRTPKSLSCHKLSHTSKTPTTTSYACEKCSKAFRWKSSLHLHIKKCSANKGAEKRKARLKAKEKLMRQIRDMSDDDDDDENPEDGEEQEELQDYNSEEEIEEEMQDNSNDEEEQDFNAEETIDNTEEPNENNEEALHENEEETLFAVQRNNELQFSEDPPIDNNSSKDDDTTDEQVTQLLLVQLKEAENNEIPVEIKNEVLNSATSESEQATFSVTVNDGFKNVTSINEEASTRETTVQVLENMEADNNGSINANQPGEISKVNELITSVAQELEQRQQHQQQEVLVNITSSGNSNEGVMISLSEDTLATVQISLPNATVEDENEVL